MTKLTGRCFNCGAPMLLFKDGMYEDKECCYDCFSRHFRHLVGPGSAAEGVEVEDEKASA